jgi:aryl-alcohol dehydrogenase-like predicted oxidoreductase
VVLIHSDGRDVEIVERSGAVEELERMRAAGMVGQIGMSTKTVEGALAAVDRMDVVMVTLNEKETADLPAIARARELGKGVVVKKALGQGSAVGSLGFAVRTPGVSSVVVGTVDAGHLKENARGIE